MLREDNAASRLTPIGKRVGLISDSRWDQFTASEQEVKRTVEILRQTLVSPTIAVNEIVSSLGSAPLKKQVSLSELVSRPELQIGTVLAAFGAGIAGVESNASLERAEIEIKYAGYIEAEAEAAARLGSLEQVKIPDSMAYSRVPGLSSEAREKLEKIRPATLGQASRIPGITPAAISILMVKLKMTF